MISSAVHNELLDLNPNESNRPLRDGEWIRKNYQSLSSEISLIWDKFKRSGEQNGDLHSKVGIDDWVLNFATASTQTVKYSCLNPFQQN